MGHCHGDETYFICRLECMYVQCTWVEWADAICMWHECLMKTLGTFFIHFKAQHNTPFSGTLSEECWCDFEICFSRHKLVFRISSADDDVVKRKVLTLRIASLCELWRKISTLFNTNLTTQLNISTFHKHTYDQSIPWNLKNNLHSMTNNFLEY